MDPEFGGAVEGSWLEEIASLAGELLDKRDMICGDEGLSRPGELLEGGAWRVYGSEIHKQSLASLTQIGETFYAEMRL